MVGWLIHPILGFVGGLAFRYWYSGFQHSDGHIRFYIEDFAVRYGYGDVYWYGKKDWWYYYSKNHSNYCYARKQSNGSLWYTCP